MYINPLFNFRMSGVNNKRHRSEGKKQWSVILIDKTVIKRKLMNFTYTI